MNPTESPRTPKDVHEDVVLLQFSSELRTSLQGEIPEIDAALPTKSPSSLPPRRPLFQRWWLLLIFLLPPLLGAGFLELGYHPPPKHTTQSSSERLQRQKTLLLLKELRAKSSLVSETRFLKKMKRTLSSLKALREQHCMQRSALHVEWPPALRWGKAALEPLRRALSSRLQSPYNRLRRSVSVGRNTTTENQRREKCLQRLQPLQDKVTGFLRQKTNSFLRQAQIHLRYFAWCRSTWLKNTYTPQQQKHYERFRKSRRCERKCWGSRFRSRRCRRCWKRWQNETSPHRSTFQRHFRFVQQEKLRQCRIWRNGKPAEGGVFHLGSYYWRVQRVLSMQRVLETLGLCGQDCKRLRREWGFRLTLTSQPKNAQMFLELWKKGFQAPTRTLQRLSRQVLVADGRERWLPAIRTQGLRTKTLPQDLWYLFHFYDPRTGKRALWPVAPAPGSRLQHKVPLTPIRIQSDGRVQPRLLRFSRDGKWLAYTLEKGRPWASSPPSSHPLCRGVTKKERITTLMLKKIKDDLFQKVDEIFQLRVSTGISSLAIGGGEGSLSLFFQAQSAPNSLAGQGWRLRGKRSLWKLPLFPTLGKAGVFGKPRLLQRSPAGSVTIPISVRSGDVVSFRRSCPGPTKTVKLFQRKDSAKKWSVRLPPGFALDQIVQQPDNRLTLLLQKQGQSYLLTDLPRTGARKATSPRQTGHLFAQVACGKQRWVLGGGPEGAPLREWSGNRWATLLKGTKGLRYLNPVVHPVTGRLYFLEQWNVAGSKRPEHRVSFLVSMQKKARP